MTLLVLKSSCCPECKAHPNETHAPECYSGFQIGLARAAPGMLEWIDFDHAEHIEEIFRDQSVDRPTRARRALEFARELAASHAVDARAMSD